MYQFIGEPYRLDVHRLKLTCLIILIYRLKVSQDCAQGVQSFGEGRTFLR